MRGIPACAASKRAAASELRQSRPREKARARRAPSHPEQTSERLPRLAHSILAGDVHMKARSPRRCHPPLRVHTPQPPCGPRPTPGVGSAMLCISPIGHSEPQPDAHLHLAPSDALEPPLFSPSVSRIAHSNRKPDDAPLSLCPHAPRMPQHYHPQHQWSHHFHAASTNRPSHTPTRRCPAGPLPTPRHANPLSPADTLHPEPPRMSAVASAIL